MKYLFILNDGPYGSERSYNALRLAGSLVKQDDAEVKVFLIGDAAICGQTGQVTPRGYYNMEQMIKAVLARGGQVGLCGSCSDARGITEDRVVQGAHRSSMEELTNWTLEADKVLVF